MDNTNNTKWKQHGKEKQYKQSGIKLSQQQNRIEEKRIESRFDYGYIAQFPTEVRSLTGKCSLNIKTFAVIWFQNYVSDENEIIMRSFHEVAATSMSERAGKYCLARVGMGLGRVQSGLCVMQSALRLADQHCLTSYTAASRQSEPQPSGANIQCLDFFLLFFLSSVSASVPLCA